MALATQISALATRVAAEIKTLRASLPTWSTIDGKPDVIAAGANTAAARDAIGALPADVFGVAGIVVDPETLPPDGWLIIRTH